MPICRKFSKLEESEHFCRLPLTAAISLGTEIGLDQVDYIENIKSVDEAAILFTSYIEQDKNCVYRNKQETVFENGSHCTRVLAMIRDALDVPNRFDPEVSNRLFVGKDMFNNVSDLSQEVYGKMSSHLKNFIIESENLVSHIDEFLKNLESLYTLVGDSFFDDKMKLLEACFGTKIDNMQSAMNKNPRKLHYCLVNLQDRRVERSTLFSYVFGSGEQVDSLNNRIVDMAGTLNTNIENIRKNEHFLMKKEQELQQQSLSMSRKLDILKASFNALNFEYKKMFHVSSVENANVYKFGQKVMDIERLLVYFNEQLRMINDILMSTKKVECYNIHSNICLNPAASWIQMRNGDLRIHIQTLVTSPKSTVYVSCMADWETLKVSSLHNTHMALNDQMLVGDGLKIKQKDLETKSIVNTEMKSIADYLIHDNIFITVKDKLLGFSCLKDELLFVGSGKVKCTSKIFWTKNDTDDIFSARGIISRATISNLYQKSKAKLIISNENELNNDFLTLEHQNETSLGNMLETLNKLPIDAKVGISLGVSGALILLFLAAIICVRLCWSPTVCCKPLERYRGNHNPQQEPDLLAPEPPLADEAESLTKRATEMVLSQLRGK